MNNRPRHAGGQPTGHFYAWLVWSLLMAIIVMALILQLVQGGGS